MQNQNLETFDLSKRIDRLMSELANYQEMMNNAITDENEELYKNAQTLGRETLAQIWACRKEQEKQEAKGLYYRESGLN
jgi:hypothetical protein